MVDTSSLIGCRSTNDAQDCPTGRTDAQPGEGSEGQPTLIFSRSSAKGLDFWVATSQIIYHL